MSNRNLLIRLGVYPITALLAGTLLWAYLGARRAARAESLRKQAQMEFDLGLADTAEQNARASLALDGGQTQSWATLGEILGRRARREPEGAAERLAEARAALERALELSAGDQSLTLEVADTATKAGLFDVAERAATDVLERHGASPGALWFRGRARWLAADAGPAREPARADLERACADAPSGDLPAQIGAFAMLFEDGALATVAKERLRAVAPEEPEGPAISAWLAEQAGDTKAALEHYDTAIRLAAEREQRRPAETLSADAARRRFLGELHFRRGGLRFTADPAGAADDLDAAFEARRDSPVVAHLAARARLAAGRPADAAEALAIAWRRSTGRPAVRAEILAQVRSGAWDGLPAGELRDTLRAAAAGAGK